MWLPSAGGVSHLGVSRSTIKTHTRNLYRKLGVRSRDEAVALAGTISAP